MLAGGPGAGAAGGDRFWALLGAALRGDAEATVFLATTPGWSVPDSGAGLLMIGQATLDKHVSRLAETGRTAKEVTYEHVQGQSEPSDVWAAMRTSAEEESGCDCL